MSRTAYFDLANGISGDMTLAALASVGRDLGIDVEQAIVEAVCALDLDCSVTFVEDERGGLACLRAEVTTDGTRHAAARLREAASASASPRAVAALDLLVEAEARVHGVDPSEVHLHELASADTAADLLGATVALELLGVESVAAAPVPVPSGWIRSGHGPLPLPAPVTLELLRGATLRGVDADNELVTPSGAAILVAHGATFGPMPELVLEGIGTGAGARTSERPNICRVLVGSQTATHIGRIESCVLLETNIDDQTPEGIAHAVESLIAGGALDAWVTPIVMKKSRPAFQLSVLVRAADESRIAEELFRLTTTLGVRRRATTRFVLDREEIVVDMDGHSARVKVGRLRGEVLNVAPEFVDCVRVSDATGVPVKDVYARATQLARHALA